VSLVDVVEDLLALEVLAEQEDDPDRRRALELVRTHLADRDRGAKVSEVAELLGLSQPTVRAWMEAGVLEARDETTPARVDVLSLAEIKRAVDLLREHGHDRNLLAAVMRLLRDRSALTGDGVRDGFTDLAAGRIVPVTEELLDNLSASPPRKRRSKSS
jgi:DNA-binding transcriptional ArsR family regulator